MNGVDVCSEDGTIPLLDDAFLSTGVVKRSAHAFNSIEQSVDIGNGGLNALGVPECGTNRVLHVVAGTLQSDDGALDSFGQALEFLEVGRQNFDFGALLCMEAFLSTQDCGHSDDVGSVGFDVGLIAC